MGTVLSLNVGRPREIEWLGKVALTSIWKEPVEGRRALRGHNAEGDEQSDKANHGGPDKALYAYAIEDTRWWEERIGRSLEAAAFGENLTLSGVDVTGAVVGQRWEIGEVEGEGALLEVAQPRIPCWKLGARMGDPDFPPRFGAACRPGAYLRIVRAGEIGAGDPVRVVYTPDHGITLGEVARIYHHERGRAALLLTVPELAEAIKRWARRQR